jgi:hypothetical protein
MSRAEYATKLAYDCPLNERPFRCHMIPNCFSMNVPGDLAGVEGRVLCIMRGSGKAAGGSDPLCMSSDCKPKIAWLFINGKVGTRAMV